MEEEGWRMFAKPTVSSLQIAQSWVPPIATVKRPKRTASNPAPMANMVEGREVEEALVAPNDEIRRFLQVAERIRTSTYMHTYKCNTHIRICLAKTIVMAYLSE